MVVIDSATIQTVFAYFQKIISSNMLWVGLIFVAIFGISFIPKIIGYFAKSHK